MQKTFGQLKATYPHMFEPLNRVLLTTHCEALDNIDENEVFEIIEFTRLQFMAWSTGGPIVETLSVTMCEDLVTCTVIHAIMDTSIEGDDLPPG